MKSSLANRERILGFKVTPLTARRWRGFLANRRGFWSLILFLILFGLTLPAEFIANDRPVVLSYRGDIYWPVLHEYGEEVFGGVAGLRADFTDPALIARVAQDGGWMIWPPIPYAYDTVVQNLSGPAPTPPDGVNWLGTDDQARDVLARVIYGFRISVLFGLALTAITTIIGVLAGAVQGYFGGWVDLVFQRFLEIWDSLPTLFILIIVAAVIVPGFWTLLGLLLIFSWTWPISVVRAEFLRARNLEYVRAAKALGLGDWQIMIRHMLPNAMVATLTFLPFTLSGSVTALTSLDFLGFGLPPGSPSLGELLSQGKENLQAPWLGFTGFFVIGAMLTLLIFIGEAVRDAFDPRKGQQR
jgi:microcin C transport system permease protein